MMMMCFVFVLIKVILSVMSSLLLSLLLLFTLLLLLLLLPSPPPPLQVRLGIYHSTKIHKYSRDFKRHIYIYLSHVFSLTLILDVLQSLTETINCKPYPPPLYIYLHFLFSPSLNNSSFLSADIITKHR